MDSKWFETIHYIFKDSNIQFWYVIKTTGNLMENTENVLNLFT